MSQLKSPLILNYYPCIPCNLQHVGITLYFLSFKIIFLLKYTVIYLLELFASLDNFGSLIGIFHVLDFRGMWLYLSKLDWKGTGYLWQTRGNLGQTKVAIACKNESYEVILKDICVTVMILN